MKTAVLGAIAMLTVATILAPSAAPPAATFEDRTAHSGISFVLDNLSLIHI